MGGKKKAKGTVDQNIVWFFKVVMKDKIMPKWPKNYKKSITSRNSSIVNNLNHFLKLLLV